jgi:signal transduction histidine kinase
MIESQQDSLDAMTNLLNSLLDISRLDAGAVAPEFEDFPARRLITRLSPEISRQAKHKGLNFEAEACDVVVRSDPNLLDEIIQNFVSNAIRYTDTGSVRLHSPPETAGYGFQSAIQGSASQRTSSTTSSASSTRFYNSQNAREFLHLCV